MKAREIRKVTAKPELVKGWLCVDAPATGTCVVFFPGRKRPELADDGDWDGQDPEVKWESWSHSDWRAEYGRAALPKPGKCERVKLEL